MPDAPVLGDLAVLHAYDVDGDQGTGGPDIGEAALNYLLSGAASHTPLDLRDQKGNAALTTFAAFVRSRDAHLTRVLPTLH